ncbi:peptidoglycan-binding protein LysM, partial [Prevotella merdae]
RMVEYYRGILMACDSLKAQGISTDVKAWNVPIDANVQQTLADNNAKDCDIIFGPLYTKQVKSMGDFCRRNNIKLVIPFSISGNDVASNDHIMQVYQSPQLQNELAVNAFVERFKGCHAVIVDCNDTTSRKGMFTSALRKRMEAAGIGYSITNLKSSEAMFAKAFDASKQNVVVLNTGRSPELNVTLAKLNGLKVTAPAMRISLFGYTEWLMYTKVYLEYYHRYDTYIPTSFYYNPLASRTANLERSYRRWFKSDMRQALPRFAITGYDHAQFFIRGLHKYGGKFTGTSQQSTYTPLQTPLKFKFVQGGGMQNSAFMLIHYKTNHTMESISY